MAEQRSNEYMPPVFSFMDKTTPSARRDDTQDVSSTWRAYTTCLLLYLEAQSQMPIRMPDPAICDRYINDAWKALSSRNDASDVSDATDCGSTNYAPVVSTASVDDASPSTSHAGNGNLSGTTNGTARNATGTRGREQQESCAVSGEDFSRPDALPGHANGPTGDKVPICTNCNQSSEQKSKGKCETCGKLIRRARNLAANNRTHTGERRYNCKSCDKSFAHRQTLYNHKQIHTGVKPHICEKCTKPFKSKRELTVHLRSHSSDKPFVCEICNRSFTRNGSLRSHRQRIHEGKMPYQCKQCGFRFAKKQGLDAHLCQNIAC
ncbi:zinc finger protein 239-like [Dermacentor albipictus]|uniref:zinc finger protein 239-like n=1 Tax=Dermacentor albipictus TaxID=60249 RepID=UPI0038FBF77C